MSAARRRKRRPCTIPHHTHTHAHTRARARRYDDQLLQLFVSIVYLASSCGAVVGSFVTPKYGRRCTIFVGAITFLVGAALQVCARARPPPSSAPPPRMIPI